MTGSKKGLAALILLFLLAGWASAPPQPAPRPTPEPLPVPLPPVAVATPSPQSTPAPEPAPTPEAYPPPAPTPGPPAPPLRPGEIPLRADVQPPLIRVLLSAPAVPAFPQPGRRYVTVSGSDVRMIRGPLTATAMAGGSAGFQVGAFREEANAAGAAARLTAAGIRSLVRTDPSGLMRVIAVPAPGQALEELRARLDAAGYSSVMRVAGVGEEIVLTGEGGEEVRANGMRLIPVDEEAVAIGGKTVRGQFELRAVAGGVAVINVLNLEEYLRGVVPAEMGPRAFPALEALKAQAVAARTYAVAHLGEHAADGYDICDTQSCQVYAGAGAEHPLTDRAVRETQSLVATFQGQPIDAMYHSTCGGHTEDAAEVFPERAAPYLTGVACSSPRTLVVGSAAGDGGWLDRTASLALIADRVAARLGVEASPVAVAARLGDSKAKGTGTAALVSTFGLDDAGLLLHDRAGDGDGWVLRLMEIFRTELPPMRAGDDRTRWELALVTRLAELSGALREVKGRVLAGDSGTRFTTDDGDVAFDVGQGVTVLERRGASWRVAQVETLPGSPATAWLMGDAAFALEVEVQTDADGASAWSWWAREVPASEVGRAANVAQVGRVVVTARGDSGRATSVNVVGARETRTMRGILFRYALGLPDTLFVVSERQTPAGKVFRFVGRGWGHGVGMCQNGAYGLARGGASFEEILKTYYTGIAISPWSGTSHAGGAQ